MCVFRNSAQNILPVDGESERHCYWEVLSDDCGFILLAGNRKVAVKKLREQREHRAKAESASYNAAKPLLQL